MSKRPEARKPRSSRVAFSFLLNVYFSHLHSIASANILCMSLAMIAAHISCLSDLACIAEKLGDTTRVYSTSQSGEGKRISQWRDSLHERSRWAILAAHGCVVWETFCYQIPAQVLSSPGACQRWCKSMCGKYLKHVLSVVFNRHECFDTRF